MSIIVPDIKAGAILADPPRAFVARSAKGEGRAPQHHYSCMTFEELATIPMVSFAADDCFLFLWVPLRSVYLVRPLMEAWGFNFSGAAFAWAKLNASGVGWFMGGGYGTRHNVEVCWLGRRGSPRRKSAGVRELIVAPRRQHSRKPDETHDRIEALCDGPYLELFARARRPGWICAGDQVDMFSNTNQENGHDDYRDETFRSLRRQPHCPAIEQDCRRRSQGRGRRLFQRDHRSRDRTRRHCTRGP